MESLSEEVEEANLVSVREKVKFCDMVAELTAF